MEKASAIIVAAGKGVRFGGPVKKQFVKIGDRPILYHTIEKFEQCPAIGEIILVLSPEDVLSVTQDLEKTEFHKVTHIVPGGSSRFQSVVKGLECAPSYDLVAIHDGVRPFVPQEKIQQVVAMAARSGAAILAVQPNETVKEIRHGIISATLDRNRLRLAQTPQVFRKQIIMAAARNAQEKALSGTDDATLVELIGVAVTVIEGDYQNIKITTQEDLLYAQLLTGVSG